MKQELLSVVIPAYNEERRIGRAVSAVHSYFSERNIKHEIIIVDDGSTDRTRAIALKKVKLKNNLRVLIHERNRGKGAAVRTGVKEARGIWILLTDADLSVPLPEFQKLWISLEAGHNVAIATRSARGATVLRGQGLVRSFFGRLFRCLTRILLIADVSDTQCGFKLMSAGIGKEAFSKTATDGPLFDIEFLLNAHRLGAVIGEVPVVWAHDPRTTIPYSFPSALAVFRDLVLLKLRFTIILPLTIT